MKQIFLTLTIIGISLSTTVAQTSSNAKNYKVCRVNGVYHTCNDDDALVVNTKQEADKPAAVQASMRKFDTYTTVKSKPLMVLSNKKNKKIITSYDAPDEMYFGGSVKANGTLEANKGRNMNYLNTSNPIPPMDGNNSDKK